METLTIDLEDDARRALDRLARHTNRSVNDLMSQAVRDYLEPQEWQRGKSDAGVAAADRGDFADDRELARIAGKYSMRR